MRFDCDFPTALRRLVAENGISLTKLAAATREHDPEGRGITQAHLSTVLGGSRPVTRRLMLAVSGVFGFDACAFVEYRAATVRDAFDERVVDYARLQSNIDLLHAWLENQRSPLAAMLLPTLDCDRAATSRSRASTTRSR